MLASLLLAVASAAALDIRRLASPRSVAQTVDLPKAQFVAEFTGSVPRSAQKNAILRQLRGPASKTIQIAGSDGDEEYLTNITIGGQHFDVIIDTGRYGVP